MARRCLCGRLLLMVLPAAMLTGYRLLLLPRFPQTHALSGDWYNHALYGTVFLLGFLVARTDSVWVAFQRLRWLALATAMTLFVSGLVLRELYPIGQPMPLALKIYAGTAYGCYQWFCIVAVLGFARRWLNRDSSARRYLTDAVFPYYIVHQTAIILIAHELRGLRPAGIDRGEHRGIGHACQLCRDLRDRPPCARAAAAVWTETWNALCPLGSTSTGMQLRRFARRPGRRWRRHGSSQAIPPRFTPKAARPAGWSRTPGPRLLARSAPQPRNLVFTSGGTEANALALTPGLRRGSGLAVERLLVSAIEHASVLAGGRFPAEAIGVVGVTAPACWIWIVCARSSRAGRRRWCR